jgi:cold shock CspA family protein/ribosome-associated translation inhibitor RaiA
MKEAGMEIPPEIIIKDIERTPDIEKAISRGIAKLERVCNYIISTRVAVERAQGRRREGNPYDVRIDIHIPDRADIVVKRSSKASKKVPARLERPRIRPAIQSEMEPDEVSPVGRVPVPRRKIPEETLPELIRRAFESARRSLEKEVEKQHGQVKLHNHQQYHAVVEKVFRDQDFGFLRTPDGDQVYFHRNSVLHGHWDRLTPGTMVRFAPEMGEKGRQASTVELLSKPGDAEKHNGLPEPPEATSNE